MKYFIKSIFIVLFISFLNDVNAQFIQLGNKLVGTGYTGRPFQGYSVAISGDGNTAIVGAPFNNSERGSVWIYVKNNGAWSQQAALYGTGYIGYPNQGHSVSISADGNTAIVGGHRDNADIGAAWIFTRQNGHWSQQGSKLVGSGVVGAARQGWSVSISADGNTAILGGLEDDNNVGAAWIFVRQNGQWLQQGSKLVGSGTAGYVQQQGRSVSLSADGNTAIVGGYGDIDNGYLGGAWIFTRHNGHWSQQGSKLVGSGVIGAARQGQSVSISADGNTAIVSGYGDNNGQGAAWIFVRQNGQWSQQGSKLVGSGVIGYAAQGTSVSLSGDGNTAIVGGPYDNNYIGASWIFVRQGGQWIQQGSKFAGSDVLGQAYQGTSVSISADGNTAIVGGPNDNYMQGGAWIFTTYNTISAIIGSGGTISPSGNVIVSYGSNQAFTITPNAGYHILDVLADGVSQGAVASYTFTNVTADHTISASFAIDQFTITSSAGLHGTISPSGNTLVNYGESQTYNFNPDEGYHVSNVVVDGTSKGAQPGYTFSNVIGSHTILVSFAPDKYIISSQAESGGTITPTGNVEVPYGENQVFTITPNEGYHILDVVVNGVSKGAQSSYTFETVYENGSITAKFAINQYPITAISGSGGSITPTGTMYISYHGSQTYTVTPDAGYHIQDVLIDGTSKGAISSYTFSDVVGEHTISASYAINTYKMTSSSGEGGTITPLGELAVNWGSSQTYAITPSQGYHIMDVVVDGESKGPVTSYTFANVQTSHTISAEFTITGYSITSSAGEHGAINPSGNTLVNYGSSHTYTITPDQGYHVLDVTVDNQSRGAQTSYTFTNVTENHSISATFAINSFTITATQSEHGTITPEGVTNVSSGESETYSITPDQGYYISDVLADNQSVGAVTSYTFTNVTSNHSITGQFAINTYKITSTAGEHGTITPSGEVNVNYGATQEYTVTAASGYHISDVVVDGQSKGPLNTYKFENINSDHTISAQFAMDTPEELPVPIAVSPKGGVIIYSNIPTLFWAVDGSSSGLTFRVRYSTDPNKGNANGDLHTIDAGSSTSYTLPPLQWGKSYYWQVQSVKGTSTSAYSSIESFRVVEEQVVVVPPSPIAAWPLSGSVVYFSYPPLIWYMLSGWCNVDSYTLRWGEGTSLNNVVNGITKITYMISGLLSGHTYSWTVESVDRFGNHSVPSPIQTFMTSGGSSDKPYTPVQVYPVSETLVYTSSPVLTWYVLQEDFKISSYKVRYSKNPDMTNSTEVSTNGPVCALTLVGLEKGRTYYWQVQSYDGQIYSDPQIPPASFSICSNQMAMTPVILSPQGSVGLKTTSVDLSWAVRGNSKGVKYNLQYSTDPEFKSAVEVKNILECSFKALNLSSSTYYWRVRAKTSEGGESEYSPSGKFSISTVTGLLVDKLNKDEFSLLQNFPNPFNPATSIVFNLPEESYVTLEVYNSIGKSVGKLFEGQRPKGVSSMQFNAETLPSGIYFYKIIAIGQNGHTNYDIKKMLFLK